MENPKINNLTGGSLMNRRSIKMATSLSTEQSGGALEGCQAQAQAQAQALEGC